METTQGGKASDRFKPFQLGRISGSLRSAFDTLTKVVGSKGLIEHQVCQRQSTFKRL